MRTLIAIDPGQSGGIAIIDYHKVLNEMKDHYIVQESLTTVHNMPSTIKDLHYLFSEIIGDKVVYIEDVHSLPNQGIASTFKFGRGFGNLEAMAISHNCRLIYVRPQVWQKHLGLLSKKGESKTQHKNRMKAFAQQRYPHIKVTLATADALCILEYAKEKEK